MSEETKAKPSRKQIAEQNRIARAWATWAAMTAAEQSAEKLRSRALEAAAFALCPIMEREGVDVIAAIGY